MVNLDKPQSAVPAYHAGLWEIMFGMGWRRKSVLYRQLATSVGSGLGLDRATQLAGVCFSASVRRDMRECWGAGMSFSKIWERYPAYFSGFEIALIRAGEVSGNLDKNLLKLAEYSEARQEQQGEMWGQALYPIILVHAAIVIPSVPMLVTCCPAVFATTVLCMLLPLYAVAIAVAILHRIAALNEDVAQGISAVESWIPVVGGLKRLEAQATFLEMLAQLLEAGMSAVESVDLAARASGSALFRKRLHCMEEVWNRGGNITQALTEARLFDEQVLAMLAVGEETGQLSSTALKAAEWLRASAVRKRKALITVLSVLVLLLVGVLVGYRVIGMFSGYTNVLQEVM